MLSFCKDADVNYYSVDDLIDKIYYYYYISVQHVNNANWDEIIPIYNFTRQSYC